MKKFLLLITGVMCMSLHLRGQIWAEVYGLYSWPVRDVVRSGQRSITATDGSSVVYKLEDVFSQIAQPTLGSGMSLHYLRDRWDIGFDIRLVEPAPKLDFVRANLLTVGLMADRYVRITDQMAAFAGAEISMVQSRVYYQRGQIDQPRLDQTRPGIGLRTGVAFRILPALAGRAGFRLTGAHIFPTAEVLLGLGYSLGDY